LTKKNPKKKHTKKHGVNKDATDHQTTQPYLKMLRYALNVAARGCLVYALTIISLTKSTTFMRHRYYTALQRLKPFSTGEAWKLTYHLESASATQPTKETNRAKFGHNLFLNQGYVHVI
jgi:hypothetical protein